MELYSKKCWRFSEHKAHFSLQQIFVFLKWLHGLKQNKTFTCQQQRSISMCGAAVSSWQNHLHFHHDWNPQKASGWLMLLSTDCLSLYSPKQLRATDAAWVMKRQPVEAALTLIWRHAGISDFPTSPSFVWLCVCLCSIKLLCSFTVCTASNVCKEYEGGWHAKQPYAMWTSSSF